MAETGLADRAAVVQRDLRATVGSFRPTRARTLATFEEGRSETGRMAGLQMGYWKDRAHGQTLYNPLAGDTSFKKSTKQTTGAMYVAPAYRNMNFWMEEHVMLDMSRGFIPDSYIKERRRRIATHMWKKNWAAIGTGNASIAVVSTASGTTVTCLADNSAWGTSKGTYRLQNSVAADPLLYDAINASDAVVATFYVTAKPTNTTATVVFTVGNAAAMATSGFNICETGQWKKEMNGIGGLISDSTTRIFQGADVAVDDFLQNKSVDAGNAVVTPTLIHALKSVITTRGNNSESDYSHIAHLTENNYRDLAKHSYPLRIVDTANKGAAMKTYGVPNVYEDGDTMFVPDADFEECFIVLRERGQYFEYVQKKFGLKETGGVSRFQYQGTNNAGSTNAFENYNEAVNLVWDGKGKDGTGSEDGSPASAVIVKNIAYPAIRQNVYGV